MDAVIQLRNEAHALDLKLREVYSKRFASLSDLLPTSFAYASAVIAIGYQTALEELTIPGVPEAASLLVLMNPEAHSLPQMSEVVAEALSIAHSILATHDEITRLLPEVEEATTARAPALSIVVSPKVAAQLLLAAGSLDELATVDNTSMRLLAKDQPLPLGLSRHATNAHFGAIFLSPFVQDAPRELRTRIARLVSSKAVLAARTDCFGDHAVSLKAGKRYSEEISAKISKLMEPSDPPQKKPLPLPQLKRKKQRRGRRRRKYVERMRMGELEQLQRRIQLGVPERETIDGVGLGSIGTGRHRVDLPKLSRQSLL